MFRKGGKINSKGTGVMSMVEPRENYAVGTSIQNIRDLQSKYQTAVMEASKPSGGEKAALIAQFASTPGGLYEKVMATLPTQAKIAAQQRALKPELLKSQIAGEIDIAKLQAAGIQKAGATEKDYTFTFNKFKQLRDAGIEGYKGKSDSELSDMALTEASNKFRTRRAPEDVDTGVVTANAEMYSKLMNNLSTAINQQEYDENLTKLMILKNAMEVAGLSETGSKRLFGNIPVLKLKQRKKMAVELICKKVEMLLLER